ncbi:LysR family transcriptional regulator [Variovorax beijingensis]|jgi:LysR family glycine cleavage system transcriptional activator|uniref:LysR family glycine cleavage system transcriptional activator n=2 Tax=Variovorax TaxID=34072 RepID=A0AAE3Y1R5_VARPD|nr:MULTISPECIES: LysR substrate-binding domain-containing protein [Variovorax]MBD9667189.1 LysR family transcriptional regulator [Variovorax sp. VRV01]MDR6428860.1 LysR family glycine cleavage system transcriptional activator [Variovorax paradoxus]MDR6455814.1 LysR family glycine cleavage system transcriptional activator [Variovorax paradoxus]TWD77151.1 LysR family transcriptional regulator [Variovorax beijingensis]
MRKLPPLRSLHAFEAAARHGSFKAAAVELSVTPTAISHQIRLLEEACGRQLFQRRPRPLVLTSAGASLYPALRNGFDVLAGAIASLSEAEVQKPLRVTSPSAFASRWLVPRLPKWREANPIVPLEIIGTDAVLDLRSGAADVAIRYARRPPLEFTVHEICRDRFFPVCSPGLLADQGGPIQRVADLLRLPLIHFDWMSRDPEAPNWRQWLAMARSIDPALATDKVWDLSFREEIHAIDAVVAGQGVAICSDIVISRELESGTLVKAHPLALPGYGFYVVSTPHSPRAGAIEAFLAWIRSVI